MDRSASIPRVLLNAGGTAGLGLSGKLKNLRKSITRSVGIGRKPLRSVSNAVGCWISRRFAFS